MKPETRQDTRSTCPYCGVGCGVIIESRGAQVIGVRGDPDHPANFGRLCTKGSTLHLTAAPALARQARLLQPMRRATRGAAAQPVSWEFALDEAAGKLADVWQRHGADAIGVYVSGQLLTEDYYVFNKLVKGLFGSNHIDTNSRLCMSSAVAGYKATLGADAPPCSYEDLGLADSVFIIGSNMAWAHPILFRRLEDAKRARPDQRWVVIDPRRTETADSADLHLALRPGSDIALFHGLLHVIVAEGRLAQGHIDAHTQGFAALAARVRDFTPARTAALTGLDEADIVTAARWFAQSPATLSLYCQGLNQSSSGTAKNAALINLHLATAQIGRPGAGPFSLTGQPNAMGGREVGGLANLLSAHRDLADPVQRAEVATLWGVPDVPAKVGRTAVEMFQAAADGELRALWIACTNPAQSLPDQATVQRALERTDFVIVQEAFAGTRTAAYADLLLPAATWGEKEGTVTNSERRISRVRAAVPPAGEARADWAIAADIARRVAARIAPERVRLFDYASPEAVWNEHRESTRGRDLDITGLSYAKLEADGPQQWPLPEGETSGRARLYADGRYATADGRARFADVAFVPLAEACDTAYPYALNTGRLRDQWHGMSRTGLLGRLYGHDGLPSVEIHPQDLAELGASEGELLQVRSRRGSVVLSARASERQQPGQVFIAMHWGGEVLAGAGVNALTSPVTCPRSRQPELKHAAVAVERVTLPWRLSAMAWLDEEQAWAVRERIHAGLAGFAHASLLPFGREPDGGARIGLVLRVANPVAPPAELLAAWRQALGLGESAGLLVYDDARRGQQRLLRLRRSDEGERRLDGFWLVANGGEGGGEAWLSTLIAADQALDMPSRALLAPASIAQKLARPASPQVCSCFDVRADRIEAALACIGGDPAERLGALQQQLRCGTNCGSCLPALRTMIRLQPVTS